MSHLGKLGIISFADQDGFARRDAAAAGAASLSKSHNSDSTLPPDESGQAQLPFRLSGSQAKTAFALRHNAERMVEEGGLNSVGFATLTVGDALPCAEVGCGGCVLKTHFRGVCDAAEASRRINNLHRRILPLLFEKTIIVTERHKSGAVHFHILGIVRGRPDIRTGFDWQEVRRQRYASASRELRRIWAFLRKRLPEYGFGRAELTPIRKTGEAVASYVAKYVEKNLFNRLPEDKGKKLVRYSGWGKRQLKPNEFSWATERACAWRTKARQLAGLVGVKDKEEMAERMGPRWAFKVTEVIRCVDDTADRHGFEWAGGCPGPENLEFRNVARGFMASHSARWKRSLERFAQADREAEAYFREVWIEEPRSTRTLKQAEFNIN